MFSINLTISSAHSWRFRRVVVAKLISIEPGFASVWARENRLRKAQSRRNAGRKCAESKKLRSTWTWSLIRSAGRRYSPFALGVVVMDSFATTANETYAKVWIRLRRVHRTRETTLKVFGRGSGGVTARRPSLCRFATTKSCVKMLLQITARTGRAEAAAADKQTRVGATGESNAGLL